MTGQKVSITNIEDIADAVAGADNTALASLQAVVQQPIRFASSVTITCAAAGDYAAGDVLSNSASNNVGVATYVANLSRTAGLPAVIVAIRAISSNASLLSRMRCQWFTTMPLPANVEMDDNAVFGFTTATGRDQWVGSTLTSAFTAKGTSDTMAMQEPLRTAPTDAGLWLVLTTEDAETNEAANQTIRLDFYTL